MYKWPPSISFSIRGCGYWPTCPHFALVIEAQMILLLEHFKDITLGI